jgi:hypothetical protein
MLSVICARQESIINNEFGLKKGLFPFPPNFFNSHFHSVLIDPFLLIRSNQDAFGKFPLGNVFLLKTTKGGSFPPSDVTLNTFAASYLNTQG